VQSNLLAFDDWDWAGASCEIEIALRLDPESPLVRSSAASYNLCAGRHERAMMDVQIALRAAPPSVTLVLQLANILIHSGRYRDAITTLSNLLKSDSTCNIARRYRAQACLLDGRPADAIVDLNLLAPDQSEESSLRLPLLARAYADSGEQSRAAGIYSTLLNARRNGSSTFWSLALIATGLGNFEEAVCHLERALQVREPALLFLKG
jgi:predicted Zn-dependent protease